MNIKVIFSIIFGFTVLATLVACSDEAEDEVTQLNKEIGNR